VLYLFPSSARAFVSVKVAPDDLAGTIAFLEDTWRRFVPGWPFEYTFLDEEVERLYRSDRRFGLFFGYASALAILIACLGLFGLTAFTAERRTKEIGIRKVLGASVSQVVLLLTGDFLKPVGLAFLLAVPVAFLTMQRWLETFAYRIDLGPGVFLQAGALAFGVALAAVGWLSLRAALADPGRSLRYE
jgi:putative ABC transport system permease protein